MSELDGEPLRTILRCSVLGILGRASLSMDKGQRYLASTIETSVRRALQEGNADDPDFRVQVYEAAERAIQRVVVEKGVGQDVADRQLEQLIAAIERIEADYPPAGPEAPYAPGADEAGTEPAPAGFEMSEPDDDAGPVPQVPPGSGDPSEPFDGAIEDARPADASPRPDAPLPLREARTADTVSEPHRLDSAGEWSPGNRQRSASSRRSSRWLVGLVAAILVLALLAGAAWWFSASILQTPQAEPEGATVEDAIRAASGEGGEASGDWIGIFSGSEIANVRAVDGGRVAAEQVAGGQPAVRIEVPAVGGGTEIGLVIGPGVVRSLGGQTVRGELTVGSPDGTRREFSLRCLFAGETTCGRQRFATSIAEETFVFDMEIPAGATQEGQIAIDPGIGQETRDLMIFGLRVRPAG